MNKYEKQYAFYKSLKDEEFYNESRNLELLEQATKNLCDFFSNTINHLTKYIN